MPSDRAAKIGIIGAGSVGATIAYAAMMRGVARQIALFDIASAKVRAEVLDLNHGMLFAPPGALEGSDDIEVLRGCDVVVMTAGAKQKPGETRMDLAAANARICASLLPKVVVVAPNAHLLLVTNPVDVITQIAIKLTGLPWNRVFGSGTVLDSSRFRFLIARHCSVAVQNVHAYIAGERGDSEIPLWSSAILVQSPFREESNIVRNETSKNSQPRKESNRNCVEMKFGKIELHLKPGSHLTPVHFMRAYDNRPTPPSVAPPPLSPEPCASPLRDPATPSTPQLRLQLHQHTLQYETSDSSISSQLGCNERPSRCRLPRRSECFLLSILTSLRPDNKRFHLPA